MTRDEITREDMATKLRYDPETGHLYTQRTGARAGYVGARHGYLVVDVFGFHFRAHRVAWFLMTGKWPTFIDHKNRNKTDNRWSNLREATRSQNQHNAKPSRKNKLGLRGVSYQPLNGKYFASIKINKQYHYLGQFDTAEAAKRAYDAKAIEFYGEFCLL